MKRRFFVVGTILLILVSFLFVQYGPAWALEYGLRRAEVALGVSIEARGVSAGRVIRIDRVMARLPGATDPSAVIGNLVIKPDWRAIFGGAIAIESIRADSVIVRLGDRERAWWMARPSDGETLRGSIDRLDLPAASILLPQDRVDLHLAIAGLTSAGWRRCELEARLNDTAAVLAFDGERGESHSARLAASGRGLRILDLFASPLSGILRTETAAIADWRVDLEYSRPVLETAPDSGTAPLPLARLAAFLDQGVLDLGIAFRDVAGETLLAVTANGQGDTKGIAFKAFARGCGAMDGATRLGETTLVLRATLEVAWEEFVIRGGEINLAVDLGETPAIRNGSGLAVPAFSARGVSFPGFTVDITGNYDSGFLLVGGGATGRWRGVIRPVRCEARFEGEFYPPRVLGFRDATAAGDFAVDWSGPNWFWRTTAEVHGERPFSGAVVRFAGQVRASGSKDQIQADISRLELSGRHKRDAWFISLPAVRFEESAGARRLAVERPGEIRYAGKRATLAGSARLGADGAGVTEGLVIAGVPVRLAFRLDRGVFRQVDISIAPTPLGLLAFLMTPEVRAIWDRSEVDGTFAAEMTYDNHNRLDGQLNLAMERFRDPVSGFFVEGARIEAPIRQRFVGAGEVRFEDDAARWPEVSENIRIRRIGRYNISAENLRAKGLFADYVFRARDVEFQILGATARSRLMFDPFRHPDGRWRTALEIRADDLELRRLYEEFVGTGKAAATLEGRLGLFIETAWSDTECLEARGRITSERRGTIGAPVIRSLVGMLDTASRPPDLALFLIGAYHFDTIGIQLRRDPAIRDFRTLLIMTARREPFLQEFRLEAPLLRLYEGLPVEVHSDLRARRAR